ncbi:MAG: putative Ig domain-containing protein [Candidatus Sulfopaludibacter sp.]|nr:putative Ig domain-containing protein [Candidatus Sulfopaludibacter sp.]
MKLTIRAALVAALCSGAVPAANVLAVSPASVALSCNTATGPGAAGTIVVKPVATLTGNTLSVSVSASNGELVITPPASTVLNAASQSQGLTYSVNLAPGCAGASTGSANVRFYSGGVPDAQVAVSTSLTATASALVASPVTVTCVRRAGSGVTYTPGPAQTITITSAAAGGTPFSLDASQVPAWLAVNSVSGVAGATGIPLIVSAASPCGSLPVGGSSTASIHLRNLPAPDALIPVTLQVLGPTPLTATPAAPALSYTKGSATPASVDVALSASGTATPSFTVDTASLPPWLSVDAASGTVPVSLHFATTSVADAIAQGTYNATVHVLVAGSADLALPFRLSVTNPPPTLTVVEGTTRNISWTVGQALPIPYITLASNGAPISYSIATAGPLSPIIGSNYLKGLAYSYDTPIPVTFDQNVLSAAQPGTVVTGTVSIAWGSPAVTTVVTLNLSVQSAAASVLSVSPASVPTAAAGQTFTVALAGSGFIGGADASLRTTVGLVSGGALAADANLASLVVNASNIIVTLTVPAAADALLPFDPAGPGGTITLGVCNPLGAACTVPTGMATLTIGAKPVIQSVTSASSYLQVAAPNVPSVAPYDMISVFGFNFCSAGGTGCGKSILYGTLDPVALRYPATLSPDPDGAARRLVSVTFQTHATPPVPIANAPLLFATDGQINLLVPSAVSTFLSKSVDLVVNFGASSSAPFAVAIAAADPGIFGMSADGQGAGAILSLDDSLIGSGNEAAMRQTAADSDTVQIFGTGLGAPDGTADNTTSGASLWPADCAGTASFLNSLNTLTSGSSTTLDGALIASTALGAGRLVPCLRSAAALPAVTVGGQPATVTYAGWVPDSVAGLYQVNVRLPGSSAGPFTLASGETLAGPLTAAVDLPVVITSRGVASQPGITIRVAPRLKVAAPATAALRGIVGVAWSATGSAVAAGEGTAPYQFAVTAGSLPAGIMLNLATGTISGTPAAGTAGAYPVTVTATDSAASPLTGSATFTLTVGTGQ